MDRDKLINNIREMMSLGGAGGTSATPAFSGKSDPKGPGSGYDPALDLRKKYGKKLNMFYRKRIQNQRKKNASK